VTQEIEHRKLAIAAHTSGESVILPGGKYFRHWADSCNERIQLTINARDESQYQWEIYVIDTALLYLALNGLGLRRHALDAGPATGQRMGDKNV